MGSWKPKINHHFLCTWLWHISLCPALIVVMSKLPVFVVVLVISPLNIKIQYVKFYSVYFTRTEAVLETTVVVIRMRKIAGRYFSNCQSQYFIFRTGLCLSRHHYRRSVVRWGCDMIDQVLWVIWIYVLGIPQWPSPCILLHPKSYWGKREHTSVWTYGIFVSSLNVVTVWLSNLLNDYKRVL